VAGANKKEIDAGRAHSYEKILYCGKSTVVPWDKIAQHWAEFKNGTIGNGKFPQWKLMVASQGKASELVDGFVAAEQRLSVGAWQPPNQAMTYGAYIDGELVNEPDGLIPLKQGNNEIGFVIWGQNIIDGIAEWDYVDFKYFNVVYGQEQQPPAEGKLAKITLTIHYAPGYEQSDLADYCDASGKCEVFSDYDTWSYEDGVLKGSRHIAPGHYTIKYVAFPPTGPGTRVYEVPVDVGTADMSIELDCPPKQ
jgi:hypothetical protein